MGGDGVGSGFQRCRESRLTSLCFFVRHPWQPSHFLLLVQEKVTKKNTPSRSRSQGHPCPCDFASRLRGLPAVRPCTVGKLAAFLAAIAARLFLHLLAATWRDPGRAKEKRGSCRRSFKDERSDVCPGSSLSGPSVERRRSDEKAACPARGARHGWRAFGDRTGALPPNPADRSEPAAARPARNRGCISLVTFFVQAKKVTRPPGRRTKPNRDERPTQREDPTNRIKMDSGFRRNDEVGRLSPE